MLSFRRKYDADGSGAIDRDEFKRFLAHRYNIVLNEYEFHKLMGDIDPDGSGEIDYHEFFEFFQFDLSPKSCCVVVVVVVAEEEFGCVLPCFPNL